METDALDLAIADILSHKFEDGKVRPVCFISGRLNLAELNRDVYDKEMSAVVYSLNQSRHCLPGAKHKTTIYSDHQNWTYFKTAIPLNRRQARWAEQLMQYNFDLLYQKRTSNAEAGIHSRCLAFTSQKWGTTSATNHTMLRKEQWSEVGAMQLEDKGIEVIQLLALDIDALLPEAMEKSQEKAMLDNDYREVCKQVVKQGNIDQGYAIKEDLFCYKNRIHAPEGIRLRIIGSEHDSKVAGHCGREQTLELISRNFYCTIVERDIRKYCNECDI